jgi:hypothetical protein
VRATHPHYATGDVLKPGQGEGAILSNGVTSLDGVLFDSNRHHFAGALMLEGSDEGRLDVSNCVFRNNSAIYAGVLLTNNGASNAVTMTGCEFDGNEARTTGGELAIINTAWRMAAKVLLVLKTSV